MCESVANLSTRSRHSAGDHLWFRDVELKEIAVWFVQQEWQDHEGMDG